LVAGRFELIWVKISLTLAGPILSGSFSELIIRPGIRFGLAAKAVKDTEIVVKKMKVVIAKKYFIIDFVNRKLHLCFG